MWQTGGSAVTHHRWHPAVWSSPCAGSAGSWAPPPGSSCQPAHSCPLPASPPAGGSTTTRLPQHNKTHTFSLNIHQRRVYQGWCRSESGSGMITWPECHIQTVVHLCPARTRFTKNYKCKGFLKNIHAMHALQLCSANPTFPQNQSRKQAFSDGELVKEALWVL